VVNLWLQTVYGLSPLHAGLLMLPSGTAMVAAMTAPAFARRIRPAYVITAGLTVAALGYLALTQVNSTDSLILVVVGVTITSAGSGPQAALTTNMIVAASPPERSGAAASLSETCGQLGIALGAAVMGAIATAVYGANLSGNLPGGEAGRYAHQSIIGALEAAKNLPTEQADVLLRAGREAFTSSLDVICLISALVLLLLAVIAATLLRSVGVTGGLPGTHPQSPRWPSPPSTPSSRPADPCRTLHAGSLRRLRQYEAFYNQHRPHQGITNARPLQRLPEPITDPDRLARLDIRRQDRLGGILHEYHHAA
jgi:DHA2 family multidrug resistance protein-like MFS transporter